MTQMISKTLQAVKSAKMLGRWHDQPTDPAIEPVRTACRMGEFGTARLRFLRLAEASQIRTLEHIAMGDAIRLASGLPSYTLARLCEHLPDALGRSILRGLPDGKRRGVAVILDHRRRA